MYIKSEGELGPGRSRVIEKIKAEIYLEWSKRFVKHGLVLKSQIHASLSTSIYPCVHYL